MVSSSQRIKYPFLWAWDRKMGSYHSWSERMQREAEQSNAPADCIYRKDGNWVTYRNLELYEVKHDVWQRVKELGYDAGPEPKDG